MTTGKRIKSLGFSGKRACQCLSRQIGGFGVAGALMLFAASALAAPEGICVPPIKGASSKPCDDKDEGGGSKEQGGDGGRPNFIGTSLR